MKLASVSTIVPPTLCSNSSNLDYTNRIYFERIKESSPGVSFCFIVLSLPTHICNTHIILDVPKS